MEYYVEVAGYCHGEQQYFHKAPVHGLKNVPNGTG